MGGAPATGRTCAPPRALAARHASLSDSSSLRRAAALAAANYGYRGAGWLGEHLSYPAARRLSLVAGRAFHLASGQKRAMVQRHQQRVAGGTLDRATVRARTRGVFDSYARYWLEMFRMPLEVREANIERFWTIDGYEHIEASAAAGHGTILALPHLGGWEWAGAWMAARGHKMLAVVEPVEPPELFEWFVQQRESFGLEVVPLGPDVLTRVLHALRENRIVCLLSDRDLAGDGVPAEFFGERTTLPGGPATLALRTGAALLPAGVYFTAGRGHRAVVRPPIDLARQGRLRADVERITQSLAIEFEDLIRAAPEQWHLLQPNWPSDRGEMEQQSEKPCA